MREEIYTGGGITIYIQKTKDGYLLYADADGFLTLFDEDYNWEWDYEEEQKHIVKDYAIGSKEYKKLINKYFKDVYKED